MPAIEIRPAIATDIPVLVEIDHSYTSDHVWQMDLQNDNGQIGVLFREVRLPRSVRVEYPRSPKALGDEWMLRSALLVATLDGAQVGYISLMKNVFPLATWVTDLVVTRPQRRKGIGSALVLAAQEWAATQPDSHRLIIETQPKNYPAINLAQKLGFEFCGYHDHHFANHDIAIFFAKWIR